jgi:hypothetical protein
MLDAILARGPDTLALADASRAAILALALCEHERSLDSSDLEVVGGARARTRAPRQRVRKARHSQRTNRRAPRFRQDRRASRFLDCGRVLFGSRVAETKSTTAARVPGKRNKFSLRPVLEATPVVGGSPAFEEESARSVADRGGTGSVASNGCRGRIPRFQIC